MKSTDQVIKLLAGQDRFQPNGLPPHQELTQLFAEPGMKVMGPPLQEEKDVERMGRNGNALPKRTVVKGRGPLRLSWKPLYTRIVGAAVSLLLLLVFEFFLLRLVFAWY
jgi:hypothetical protein